MVLLIMQDIFAYDLAPLSHTCTSANTKLRPVLRCTPLCWHVGFGVYKRKIKVHKVKRTGVQFISWLTIYLLG